MQQPTLVNREPIYESKYTSLVKDTISINGGHFPREVIHRPPAVVIVPVTTKSTYFLVRQWRHAAQAFLLEFPAGKVEEGMTLEETAYKELEEEIGFAAGYIEDCGTFFASPGYSTEELTVYFAKNLMPKKAEGDPDEDIEVVEMTYNDIQNAILNKEIRDSKTIAAFYLYSIRRNIIHSYA